MKQYRIGGIKDSTILYIEDWQFRFSTLKILIVGGSAFQAEITN